jgi:hypothetical protein
MWGGEFGGEARERETHGENECRLPILYFCVGRESRRTMSVAYGSPIGDEFCYYSVVQRSHFGI